ncbi:Nif3-like dinuclear metal center hexameric protein [Sanguibacter sp. 25GB23B1]|uniref:Nif3-like dinuclear metal center hexameric protein n=1 Tax=unclassified Sanguibacter TaxID=2645534 RepID=UPI0032AEE3DF
MTSIPHLSDVVSLLDARFPPRAAESWDRVGLVVGEPRREVRKVLFAVDPVRTVVEEALEWGADLLVTHHPLLLDPVSSVAATTAKGAAITSLVRGGCALYVAHTNADSAAGGVADALADLLGLVDRRPLVPADGLPLDKHVVFVPTPSAGDLVDAMTAAGAGSIGEYSRVAWTTTGIGTFVPSDDATPAIGSAGVVEEVPETRVEMVAPRAARTRVIEAMRAAHPYEEVAFDVLELAPRAAGTGLGRVGRLGSPSTLRELAQHVATVLPGTAQGVRVAGDLDSRVATVAVLGGSGGSLFDAVRAAGVDVYVTSDLRHHQVSELREEVEFQAIADGRSPESATPFVIDTAHFASEWPWLQHAEQDLVHDLGAIGTTVETRVSTRRTDPWVARVASSGPIEN